MRIGTIVLFVFFGMVLFSFLILLINGLRLGRSLNVLTQKIAVMIKRIDRSRE